MDGGTAEIWLARHGETTWSRDGRHTSVTDLPLTAHGVEQARTLASRLAGHDFALVLTSPRTRARTTAQLAGFADAVIDDDLVEWEYGDYEGVSTAEIRLAVPDWTGSPVSSSAGRSGRRAASSSPGRRSTARPATSSPSRARSGSSRATGESAVPEAQHAKAALVAEHRDRPRVEPEMPALGRG